MVGTEPLFKGQSLAVLLPLAGAAASMACWTVYRRRAIRGLQLLPLIGLLLLWLGATFRAVQQATAFNYTAFLVPLLLFMIILKPPHKDDVETVGRLLGLLTAGVAVIALLYSFSSGKTFLPPEAGLKYSLANELLGLTKRWVGPFVQENYAGPVAALVLIFAMCQRGWYRWVIGILAGWMVFASTSTTAVIGIVVGFLVLAMSTRSTPWSRIPRRTRMISGVLLIVVVGTAVFMRNPGFDGRTTVWSSYWEVLHRNPLGGVGTSGIEQALRDGTIPLYWTHAHNWFLDALVRYGVLGLFVCVGIAALSLYLTGKAAVRGPIWPVAILVSFVVMGLTEVPGDWLTWNLPTFWVVLALLASSAFPDPNQMLGRASGNASKSSL